MVTIIGTITQAGPASNPTGQYQVRYQDVTITDQQGHEWHGRIGSKQGYQAGAPISVTVEQKPGDSGPYNYFRRYNPQYPNQGSQAPAQAPQRPAQGQAAQRPPQTTPNGKDRLIVTQVVYKALATAFTGALDEFDVWLTGNQNVLKRHVDLIMQIGANVSSSQNNPNWVGENPSEPEGDIPF